MELDTLLNCDWAICPDYTDVEVKRDLCIGIRDGKIAYMGKKDESLKAKEIIHLENKAIMPGLINGHTHLPMNFFRGLADDLPFNQWLFENILPLEARLVSPDFCYIGTKLALAESIRMGVTTVCDMYYFSDSIMAACNELGVRAKIGESVTDFVAPDCKKDPMGNYKILEKMIKESEGNQRLTPMLAPHSSYSCADDLLKEAMSFAKQHSLGFNIHISETQEHNEICQKNHKCSPTQRMAELGLLDFPVAFAHGVHMSDEDIEIVASKEVGIIYNPESNMKLGSGAAPIPKMIQKGVALGIGTDSVASNNDLNIFKEMDSGAKLQKLVNADSTALSAKHCIMMATSWGARAQQLEKVGQISEGFWADFCIIDLEHEWLQPIHDLCAQVVYSANGAEVCDVMCQGEWLFRNGRHEKIELKELFSQASDYRKSMDF